MHNHSHGHVHGLEEGSAEIKHITNIGIVLNVVLSVVQLIVGYIVGSLALMTDGIHTLSDLITDFAVLIAVHFGSKKADLEHPWGHGRFETFAAAFVAVALVFAGGIMIYEAIRSIAAGHVAKASNAVLIIALVCVFSKEWLYWATRRIAVRTNSSAMYANAWHHRSDALSSIAVVLGYFALRFGFGFGDQSAAIVVGIMVLAVGAKIFNECLAEFSERAVDAEIIKDIHDIINTHTEIHEFHKLRTRTVGREVFIDFHILVDAALSLTQAHDIAEEVTENLHHHMTRPVNIIVHVEPDTPEIREASRQ